MRQDKRSKVSAEQREELIQLYMTSGRKATYELADKYGVSRNYAAVEAAARGLKRPRIAGRRYHRSKEWFKIRPTSVNTSSDPRWERAKAIGVVIA